MISPSQNGTWAIAAAIFLPYSANAYVLGPYTPDAYTLHLWHMDESATPVADADAPKVLKLLDELNDNDDVQQVYANFEISDQALESLAG